MKSKKYYLVGDRYYTSLSQITYKVREIKNNNKDNKLSPEDELYMINLFKMHPNEFHHPFLDDEILDYIDVRDDEEEIWKESGVINHCFWLNMKDGSTNRISYTKILKTDNPNLVIVNKTKEISKKNIDLSRIKLLSMSYNKQLQRKEWGRKSLEIRKRDGNKCVKCESNINLQVHHTFYVSGYHLLPWEYIDDSLITLCSKCHHNEHYDEEDNKLPLNFITLDEYNIKVQLN